MEKLPDLPRSSILLLERSMCDKAEPVLDSRAMDNLCTNSLQKSSGKIQWDLTT